MGIEDIGVKHGSRIWFRESSEFAKRGLFCVSCAGRYICAPNYIVKGTNIHECILLMIDKGILTVEVPGYPVQQARQNTAILFNRKQPHQYYANGDLQMRWLQFNGGNTEDYVSAILAKRGLVWPLKKMGLCEKYAEAALTMLEENTGNEHILSCAVHRMFAEIMTSDTTLLRSKEIALDQAALYIRQHWNESISLADIASVANFSPYYFTRLFKNYKGLPPYEYLIQTRINYAKHLLYTTDASVENIASSCGFESASDFIRQFRKRNQITPYQFRKQRF